MKFLIDGHRSRVYFRLETWPEGVAGQLLTPLTRYRRGSPVFAIDNGAYSSFNEKAFISLLKREYEMRESCLFVAVPDKVGCHKTTRELWDIKHTLASGFNLAFVAQDGYDDMPALANALFIGGTNKFKDSDECISIVKDALSRGKFVHVGRVNSPERYIKFRKAGAITCDGSGVSRYDHMLLRIKQEWEKEALNESF